MSIFIAFAILAAFLIAIVGIVGAFVPVIPGPPLNFVALGIAYFITAGHISTSFLIAMLVATVVVTVLDYVAPIWLTKVGGGSKKAMWGSTIGILLGLFFLPIGIIVGPLLGAFCGEMMVNHNMAKACKVALMSFVAFLLTTGLKFIACVVMTFYTYRALYNETANAISAFFG